MPDLYYLPRSTNIFEPFDLDLGFDLLFENIDLVNNFW